MKKTFFKTNNINRLTKAIDMLNRREPNSPGFGVMYGPAGRGKSAATEWYYANNNSFYVRLLEHTRPRLLLEYIIRAIEPTMKVSHGMDDRFWQAVKLIKKNRYPIILDEAGYLIKGHCLDTVRDLLDLTDAPIMLSGEENILTAMLEHGRFWSRVLKAAVIEWDPLSTAEVLLVVKEWTGLSMEPGAAELLNEARQGDLRDLISDFTDLERACEANKTQQITGKMAEKVVLKTMEKRKLNEQTAKRLRMVGRDMHLVGTA